jgi:hypothetical protein
MLVVGSETRRRWRVTLLAALTMALAVMVGAALPASAAATPYNKNLVRNPGAENALANPPWDTFPEGDFTRHKYGPAGYGFPPKSEGSRIHGGTYFFNGGNYDSAYGTCPDAKQDITLTGIGGAIDSGHVQVRLKGFAATNGAAEATAHLDLQFFNAGHHTDNISSWGLKKAAKSTNETYRTLQGSKVLPNHTRIVQVHLYSTPDDGSYGCQSSWDNIQVVLVHI